MSETEVAVTSPRKRLSTVDVFPFHRSKTIEAASVYWIGGFPFPIPFREREWLNRCITLLKQEFKQRGMRQENFLRFRSIAGEHSERFLAKSLQFEPLAGYAIPPDGAPVAPPTAKDVEDAIKNGGFKLADWVGDHTYWFLQQQDEEQRQEFLGIGGMLLLWLKPDPATVPPPINLPVPAQTYLDTNGQDLGKLMADLYRLQDSFLAKSKQLFGGALKDDPSFSGVPFVLPLLQARHLLQATADTWEAWFSLFDGYMVESIEDKGILLVVNDTEFDETLSKIVEQVNEEAWAWTPKTAR